MIGRANGGNSGGIDLFVVGSATRPENPKNNTIWIETSAAITSWEVGYNRPNEAEEGAVFVLTNGATSVADMEISGITGAARNQLVKITPSFAYQYVSGAWEGKNMKLYVNNGWVDTLTTLYDRGTYGPGFESGWSRGEQSNNVRLSRPDIGPIYSVSNGSVDLTGIGTVNIEWNGVAGKNPDVDFAATVAVQIIDASTSDVLWQELHNGPYSKAKTSSANVASINNTVKFRLRASGGSGSGTVILYSIKLVPGTST